MIHVALVAGCAKQEIDSLNPREDKSAKQSADVVGVSNRIRFATFNTSMNRKEQGELLAELREGKSLQISRVAGTIRRVRPDILLLNEFDYEPTGESVKLFQQNFLASETLDDGTDQDVTEAGGAGQGDPKSSGSKPIRYPYVYSAEVNTGVPTGVDLNQNEQTDDPNDAFGFGEFPGKYGMVVLSQFPIDESNVRTFQKFLWKDMPDAQLPIDPETNKPYYNDEVAKIFRLSSKSHWDVPIQVGDKTIHFLVCHPTPPVFDGNEDRNGKRNHDEIRIWADYIDPSRSEYLVDDCGKRGGLAAGDFFVIAGDMNADPNDGDSSMLAIRQLIDHPLIDSTRAPVSKGGVEQTKKQGQKNHEHKTDPATDTADFRDDTTGNMRIDYVLPSKTLNVTDAGVFWPTLDDPAFSLVRASDHRSVWIDVELP